MSHKKVNQYSLAIASVTVFFFAAYSGHGRALGAFIVVWFFTFFLCEGARESVEIARQGRKEAVMIAVIWLISLGMVGAFVYSLTGGTN